MVVIRVCTKEFPIGFNNNKKDGFAMNDLLKQQLDYYIKNALKDWDFTIIICGEGEVRVGKSVLALQIGAYWTQQMAELYKLKIPFNLKDNVIFEGRKLIEKGNMLGTKFPHSCLIFDEAGADLEGTKSMLSTTRAVKDFLRECGQYNFLNILVLPEFFDLPKGVALSRANCLLNVYYVHDEEGNFIRGYFKFYSRPAKKQLYMRGKRMLDYNSARYDFTGEFNKFYPVPEQEYRTLKIKALKKREAVTFDKKLLQRNISWYLLTKEFGMTQIELAKRLTGMGAYTFQQTIAEALKGLRLGGANLGELSKKKIKTLKE